MIIIRFTELSHGVSIILYKFKASRNYIINTHLFSHYSQQRHKIAVKLKQSQHVE